MSEHLATVRWNRGNADFGANKYSRAHDWEFDGGAVVAASASPDIVPLPLSAAENVDPEEAFVASIASCHMLYFLAIAAKRGFVVDTYTDHASGNLGKTDSGRTAMTKVTLRPDATYSGEVIPDADRIRKMHHRAHELCFIANSVTTAISTEIVS